MSEPLKWKPRDPERYVFFPGVGCTLPGSILTSEGAWVPRSNFHVARVGGMSIVAADFGAGVQSAPPMRSVRYSRPGPGGVFVVEEVGMSEEGNRAAARSVNFEDMETVANNSKLMGEVMASALKAEDAKQTGVRNKLISAAQELHRANAKILDEWGVE